MRRDTNEGAILTGTQTRVLFLADHLGYPNGVFHGVTTYFINLLPRLKENGIHLQVCFLREEHPAKEKLSELGIYPTFLASSKYDPSAVLDVLEIVNKTRIEIIHCAGNKATLIGRIVGRMTNTKVIFHLHDLLYPNALLYLLHRIFSTQQEYGICVSSAAVPVATRGYRLNEERVRVLFNGIPLSGFREASTHKLNLRKTLQLPDTAKIITVVGRFHRIKGHAGMLKIMRKVCAQMPEAYLVLVGEGPEKKKCELLTYRLGIQQNVIFLGHRDDVPQIMAESDLIAIPSLSEGLSIVAIEAQAVGKAVVGYDVGGIPDVIIDGINGRLVPYKNESRFAQAMIELLQNEQSLKHMEHFAQINANRFGIEPHIQGLLTLYAQIQASKATSPALHPAPPSRALVLLNRVKDAYRKNASEVIAWYQNGLPEFVTSAFPPSLGHGVPVFCYHVVRPEKLEADLLFLRNNKYTTLSGSEFVDFLIGKNSIPENSVLLCFDDGCRNFYDVAFPLLQKYQSRAVAFIAPGLHGNASEWRDHLDRPMTWEEIEEIHSSGLVEFQSHTLESRYVPEWPMPAPLAGCDPIIEFNRRSISPLNMEQDFLSSRLMIESRLPRAKVTQLAFPMYEGNEEAIQIAKRCGYTACYWGLKAGRALNTAGDSPYHISRMSDEFVRRLPGQGRMAFWELLPERLSRIRAGHAWRKKYGSFSHPVNQFASQGHRPS